MPHHRVPRELARRTARRARPVTPVVPFGALLAVALLLAACASPGAGDGPRSEPSVSPLAPVTPPSPVPVPSSEVGTPPPAVVSPVAGRRERRVAWRLVRESPGPAVVVEVQVGGAPCDVVTGVDVTETTTSVTLTVWAGREPGADCRGVPATLGTYRLDVRLHEPLGDRSLVPGG